MSLVSTGGADHAVFQWKVIPEGYSDDASDTGSVVGAMQNESNDEASDSDLSDVDPLDSDVEEVYFAYMFKQVLTNSVSTTFLQLASVACLANLHS